MPLSQVLLTVVEYGILRELLRLLSIVTGVPADQVFIVWVSALAQQKLNRSLIFKCDRDGQWASAISVGIVDVTTSLEKFRRLLKIILESIANKHVEALWVLVIYSFHSKAKVINDVFHFAKTSKS